MRAGATLFSELSVVFMDTTTLYFEGRGGDTLGQKGHSKDYRPHLNQMVVGIIMDQSGRPVCSEMWPGNTTDVTTLIPVIDRLRQRFAIGRVCVVADRGMISAETIAGLEERGLEYILGVRERSSKEVYEVVLNDPEPSVSLVIPRGRRPDTELEAKDVWVGDRRYVVCRNLNEAKRDAEVREAVLRSLRKSLRGGDKALVGNSAYRRYLKTPDDKHFEIDEKRVAEDARYDGLYVLRTNMRLDALAVMLRYRELLKVEDIFRTAKSILDTRPIYHQTDEAIRGHVFCSFLALVLRKALEDRLAAARLKPEWGALIRELDSLQEIETEQDDKHFVLRTPVTGDVGRVFQAVGIALPPNIRETEAVAGNADRPRRVRRGANDNIPIRKSLKQHVFRSATRAPAFTGVPRRNSSACIGCLPARCTWPSRTAPSPQAMVRRLSSTEPGAPAPSPLVERSAFTRTPSSSNQAPGNGDRPRIWLCTSRHGLRQSMRVSSLPILAA